MHATFLAPFTARDGENLAQYEWPLYAWAEEMGRDALPPRAVVLIVHGLGEHAGRYEHLARQLLGWGFAVRAYDQRGHGESGGARGALPNEMALLDDLAELVDDTRLRCLRLPHDPGSSDGTPPPLPPDPAGAQPGRLGGGPVCRAQDATGGGVGDVIPRAGSGAQWFQETAAGRLAPACARSLHQQRSGRPQHFP